MIFHLQLLASLAFLWGEHLTLELAEASFRSSALGTDSDPGPVEVPLVDLLGSLSMGTGRNRNLFL